VRAVSFVKKLNVDYRYRWRELTGSTLISGPYGMTETHTGNTFTLGMQDDDFDLRSTPIFVGLPVPGADFMICNFETGQALELGLEGEICVRTPSMMKTYWNAPDAFDAAVKDGWLHPGVIVLFVQNLAVCFEMTIKINDLLLPRFRETASFRCKIWRFYLAAPARATRIR
jgi:long-chain acyl-CoA synthetase